MVRNIGERIEESFRRIIKARSENGKGRTKASFLEEGVGFFKDKILGDKILEYFEVKQLAKYLHIIDAVGSEIEGLKLVESIPDGYIVEHGEKGHLYFERIGNDRINVGYNSHN